MNINANWARAALDVVLLVFWTGTIAWLRTGRSPAIIAGVLLTLFIAYPLYALLTPAGEHDGGMRAAQGGLFGVVFFLGLFIALLVLGVCLHRPGLVWTAFIASLIPIFVLSCSALVYTIGLFLKKSGA